MTKRILACAAAVATLIASAGCTMTIDFPEVTTQEVTTEAVTQEETTTEQVTEPVIEDYEKGVYSCFDNTLFIGNSRIDTISNFGLARNADVFAAVGLNVDTVYDQAVNQYGATIMDKVRYGDKNYDKIIISFGDNECGWVYLSSFKDSYLKLIGDLREMQPDAEIYLQQVFPISEEADSKEENIENGYTQKRINEVNEAIEDVAAESGATVIPVPAAFVDSNGYLPEDAASDGIHFDISYCREWLQYAAEFVEEQK